MHSPEKDAPHADPLPVELRFLKDQEIDPDAKRMLLEHILQEKVRAIEAPEKLKQARAAQSLEDRRFWHNTPLMVTLVGTITIAANAASNFFLKNQESYYSERIKTLESEISETSKISDALHEATKEERAFAFRVIETELAKSSDVSDRAKILLFLVRAGVLNSLNGEALQEMAEADLANPENSTIPRTLGINQRPDYDLPIPSDATATSKISSQIVALAVREINEDIEESKNPDIVQKYLEAAGLQVAPQEAADIPWSAAFVSWIVKEAGNPNGLSLSVAGIEIWKSALSKGLTFLPHERMPEAGDIIFIARNKSEVEERRAGLAGSCHSGVVYEVDGENFTSIEGNIGNAIRTSSRTTSDENIVGFVRLTDS